MNRPLDLNLCFVRSALAAFSVLIGVAATAGDTALVPVRGNFQKSDAAGMLWDFTLDGSVSDGSNDCFDNGQQLQVNGQNFPQGQPMQTKDGSELVFQGSCGGMDVTRRIALLTPEGGARYLEVLRNPSQQQVQVAVTVVGNLGGNCQGVVWSDGKPAALSGPLPKGVCGLAGMQQQGQVRPSFVWVVGDAKAKAPTTIDINNNRTFQIHWQVTVPAGKQVVLLHYGFQRSVLSPSTLTDFLKPFYRKSLYKPRIDKSWLTQIVNFRLGVPEEDAGPVLGTLEGWLGELDLARGPDDTLLVEVGSSSRMSGRAGGGPLKVTTAQGALPVTLDELAATRLSPLGALFYTRGGEILLGTACDGGLNLAAGDNVVLPFDPFKIAALVLRPQPNDGKPPEGARGFVTAGDGSRLALATLDGELAIATVWGSQRIPLAAIDAIRRVSDPRPGWILNLSDGSRLPCLPADSELVLATQRGGALRLPCPALTAMAFSNHSNPLPT